MNVLRNFFCKVKIQRIFLGELVFQFILLLINDR